MARKKKSAPRKKLVRWATADLKTLRREAGRQTLVQLARLLKRTSAAVQLKASKEGISLRRKAVKR